MEKMFAKGMGSRKSPLNWYGGKYYLRKDLTRLFPPHMNYIEVFGGAGHIAFHKKLAPGKNVYNDLNKGLYTFFNVVADESKFKKLITSLTLTPYSESVWKHCEDWELQKDEIEKARQFYIRTMQSRSNNGKSWSYAKQPRRNMSTSVSRWLGNIDNIIHCQPKLKYFEIENLDYEEVIAKYDHEFSLFYLDPPYIAETRTYKKGYLHEMDDKDHERLVDVLINTKGNIILSGYDHKIYNKLEENGFCKILLKEVVKTSVNVDRLNKKGKEYVWVNYDIPSEIIYSNIINEFFYTFNQIKTEISNEDVKIKPIQKITKTRLEKFFKEANIKNVPPDYKDIMIEFNGGIAKNVKNEQSQLFAIKYIFSVDNSEKIDEEINLKKQIEKNKDIIEMGYLPIALSIEDDLICTSLTGDETYPTMAVFDPKTRKMTYKSEYTSFMDTLTVFFHKHRLGL